MRSSQYPCAAFIAEDHPTVPPSGPGAHICALMDGKGEADALLAPAVRDYLAQQMLVVAIGGEASMEAMCTRLYGMRAVTAEQKAKGQLLVRRWTDVYATQAGFEPRKALDRLEALFSRCAEDARYAGVRLVGQMDWVVSASGGGHDVLVFERGMGRLLKAYGQAALCVYDLQRLSGQLLLGLLSTHPLALARGKVVHSPFYREHC